jgi:hypothetical protein
MTSVPRFSRNHNFQHEHKGELNQADTFDNYAFHDAPPHYSSSPGGVPYPVQMAYAYPTPFPHSYPTVDYTAPSFTSHSTLANDPPPISSGAISSRESKSHKMTTSIVDRHSFSSPHSQDSPNIFNIPASPSPAPGEGTQHLPKYLVSLVGISPSHDILSFPFIASLGRVLESNICTSTSSLTTVSENSSTTATSTTTSPTPSVSPIEFVVNYVIVPKTSSDFAQLHSLNNVILPIDDSHIKVYFSLVFFSCHITLYRFKYDVWIRYDLD